MRRVIRLFVLIEGLTFVVAALIHFGVLIQGYRHHLAGRAETVIGAVLLVGFALTWALPGATRTIGLAVQGFALLGTLVGIYTIVIGLGPRSVPDITYHVIIVIVLVAGLVAAARRSLFSKPESNRSGRV